MAIKKEICNQLSDTEIVRKSLDDLDYFSCLYERYESQFLHYIKRIALVNQAEAEDILQNAFIKIWRNMNAFDQSLKLSSWLYRIVHNEAISYWRKKKSYGKDLRVEFEDHVSEDPGVDFDTEENSEMTKAFVLQILEQLPLKYKTVLVLKFLEGMTYDEISDILKIPEGTVATRMNRAKKAFLKTSTQNQQL